MSNNNTIGERIRDLRKGKGWTQAVLAEKISVSDKAVSKWESGGGNPETSQLPILSELFGVTIDYLLTGKSNSTIVHMSKFELCAKNDDVDLLSEINNLGGQDENGQTFFQLICKYQSAKVFAKILAENKLFELVFQNRSKKHSSCYQNTFWFHNEIPKLLYLCIIANNVKNIEKCRIGSIYTLDAKYWLDDSILALLTDKRVSNGTFNYVFKMHNRQSSHRTVNILYPKILEQAINMYTQENNDETKTILKKRINTIINAFEENAKNNELHIEEEKKSRYNHYYDNRINLLSIPENIVKALVKLKAFNWLYKCQYINTISKGYVMSDRGIEIEKMKVSNKYSEEEILLHKVLYNGIVNIKELLESENCDLIKKIITRYPIHHYELLNAWFNKKDFKSLFKFSLDADFAELTDALMQSNKQKIKDSIYKSIWECFSGNWKDNKFKSDLQKVSGDNSTYLEKINYSEDSNALEKFLTYSREKIIKDLDFINLKNQTSGNLTKEHFENLLENNNLKLAIIDLCVKLESILKYQYRYEELTFEELLNKFCSNVLTTEEDDGWGYMTKSESYLIPLLHKLRKTRNNIVHPTNDCSDPITLDEFNTCLEYIFSIDKD